MTAALKFLFLEKSINGLFLFLTLRIPMSDLRSKLKNAHHFITGGLFLLKGYEKLTHHYYIIGSTIFSIGLTVIFYNLYLMRRSGSRLGPEIFIHAAEALVLFLIAYLFFEQDKVYLPYLTAAAGAGYLLSILFLIRKHRRHEAEKKFS